MNFNTHKNTKLRMTIQFPALVDLKIPTDEYIAEVMKFWMFISQKKQHVFTTDLVCV